MHRRVLEVVGDSHRHPDSHAEHEIDDGELQKAISHSELLLQR
jgi:hypothetical protein